jgi:hypothetical protein
MTPGYDFQVAGGDRARAEEQLDPIDGVEVSLASGLVSVALGSEEQLRRAWGCLEILAGAGYTIDDPQRGRAVDVDADFDDVLTTYQALERLPGR